MYGQHRDGNGGGGGSGAGFLWGGLACCCAGAGCYLAGRSYARSANELRSARRFSRISDLSMTLAASSAYLPLVTLSGKVGSDTSIIGEQSGQEAAIVVNDVTQIFLKKEKNRKDVKEYIVVKKTKEKDGTEHLFLKNKENDDPEQWIRCSEEIFSKKKEAPWYLDDGTGRLEIVRDRSTDGSLLCLASEDFEKQPRSCGCECSIKLLGLRRTEWILPIGDKLTVVGEAVKDESGKILIKRPTNGGPFHVTRNSIDKVVSNLGSDARWCKIWAATFAASGALLLGIGGYATMC
ncbi:E3 ubiquitin-protein ligase SP1-like [Miscanthus floridulus]|uniref:E3 ubiquitin-protein ligase SP1-like n=1 Tax=Miscanthus floridulus TaxID=154761 RepID=UPI003457B39B